MTTYVVSQQVESWNIHRYAVEITEVAVGIASEEEAMALVLPLAEVDSPAEVLKISRSGVSQIVARFLD